MCYANTVPISLFVSVELAAVVNLMMRSMRIKALQRQIKEIFLNTASGPHPSKLLPINKQPIPFNAYNLLGCLLLHTEVS